MILPCRASLRIASITCPFGLIKCIPQAHGILLQRGFFFFLPEMFLPCLSLPLFHS